MGEKYFLIMDYSGNYYKSDENNQLVVAEGQEDAGLYSYEEANSKLDTSMKKKFYLITEAGEDADVEPIEEKTLGYSIIDAFCDYGDEIISAARELTDAEIPEEVEKNISEYDLSKIDWREYLEHFTYIVAGLSKYKSDLFQAQSEVDQKISDILHYIELCDVDYDESADLIELLKVCRENRRDIKDELIRVDAFQKNIGTNANATKAKSALKEFGKLETRRYIPRKFSELFEGKEIKASSTKRVKRSTDSEELVANNYICEEEDAMEYVRRETPFDGKNNDWMGFAMMQAEFYRNVGQYMVNLELDIDEIDDKIDGLMREIEVSKCNVTQGYKMFKNLQELRLARKEKVTELNCLKSLTGNFDTSAMADEYEREVEVIGTELFGEEFRNAIPEDDGCVLELVGKSGSSVAV